MMARELRSELCLPAAHPVLPGHFPGRPLVPAVLLLDAAGALLQQHGLRMVAIDSAKFLAPLRPQQQATLCIRARDGTDWQFAIACAGTTIARGHLQVAAA